MKKEPLEAGDVSGRIADCALVADFAILFFHGERNKSLNEKTDPPKAGRYP